MKNHFKIALLTSIININISYAVNDFEEVKKDLTNLTSKTATISIQEDESSSFVNQPTTQFEDDLTRNLPSEIINHMTSYLDYNNAKLHQTNRYFFTSLTGYPLTEIANVGLKSIPTILSHPTFSMIRDLKIHPFSEKIPSYVWYSFIEKVINLPKDNWSDLHKTHIQEFILMNYAKPRSFSTNAMKENMFVDLVKELPETQIHTIRFYGCTISLDEICEFIKSLIGTKIHTIGFIGPKFHFSNNDITRFAKAFTGTPVENVYLTSIENSVALTLGKSCQGTSIKNIYLDYGVPEHAKEKVHYLKRTISKLTSENSDIKFHF